MPTSSKYTEPSERRGETRAGVRSPSQSDADLVIRRCAPIARPVDVALTLKSAGLGLSEAHKLLNRIVADEVVHLRVAAADREAIIDRLRQLGVAADRAPPV